MFRTDLLSITNSLNTVYTAIGICHTSYVDCLLARSGWNPTSLPGKRNVKNTLVQKLRLCTGRTAPRGSRGIALLFLDHGTRRGDGSASRLAALCPRERPGTHCTGGWVGPRAGLDRYGKSRLHRDSIPGPSSPYPVAIPTTLPGPQPR